MRIVLDLQARQSYGSHHRGIGRYALALSQAVTRQSGGHDIHLLVNAAFPHYVQEIRKDFQGLVEPDNIHVFSTPVPVVGFRSENAWRIRASECIRETFLLNLKPDIVHISSLFEGGDDDVVTSVSYSELSVKTSVTLHDLIPLMQADHYLRDQRVRSWYYRKLQSMKNAGLILPVSEYSRQEGIDLLGLDPHRVICVPNAVVGDFRPMVLQPERVRDLQARFGMSRPFVLYIGGVEYRKNVDRLIAAYAQLEPTLRAQYQLVIAGKIKDYERQHLLQVMKTQGLSSADMVLTGAILDDELIALYNMASLFVFPSLYEGFGLPVLEAMACGCPTIVADNSSLPEVVGWKEATFDGLSIDAICKKMHRVLTDQGFKQTLQARAKEQVKLFSWDASAKRALDAFESLHEQQQATQNLSLPVGKVSRVKPRLAFVGVLPPDASAAARHSAHLLPALACYYDIEIITEQPAVGDVWLESNFPIRNRQWLRENAGSYQRRIYAVSSGHCDRALLALMQEQPGTLILYTMQCSSLQTAVDMLYLSHGYQALLDLKTKGQAAIVGYPANKLFLDAASGVIAVDESAIGQAQACYGKESTMHWVSLPAEDAGQALCMSHAVGERYFNAIEQFHAEHPLAREQQLLDAIRQIAAPVAASGRDWFEVASSVANNRLLYPANKHTLFYDVSIFIVKDYATGVHRVTRHVLEELFKNPPVGYQIEPIYARDGQYRYARKMTHEMLGLEPPLIPDAVVDFHTGDLLLYVDLGLHVAVEMEQMLHSLRARGVQIYYLIHDILVLQLPEMYFDKGVIKFFQRWLEIVSQVADGLICTTQASLEDVSNWLRANPPERYDQPRLGVCTLGADIQPNDAEQLSTEQTVLLETFHSKPSILMVSTIEPRKGYTQALKAFEQLWAKGLDANLVLVGKQGWHVERLIADIESHPEQGKRLHWMKFVSNSMLSALYENCSALLMASEGEGFGLPLIEAAQHGLPIIARGIPVFREIAGEHAFYFEGKEPQALADAIQQWLVLHEQGKEPKPAGIKWITWEESAKQIKAFLFGDSRGGEVAV